MGQRDGLVCLVFNGTFSANRLYRAISVMKYTLCRAGENTQ